jgi:hypothetical protein
LLGGSGSQRQQGRGETAGARFHSGRMITFEGGGSQEGRAHPGAWPLITIPAGRGCPGRRMQT